MLLSLVVEVLLTLCLDILRHFPPWIISHGRWISLVYIELRFSVCLLPFCRHCHCTKTKSEVGLNNKIQLNLQDKWLFLVTASTVTVSLAQITAGYLQWSAYAWSVVPSTLQKIQMQLTYLTLSLVGCVGNKKKKKKIRSNNKIQGIFVLKFPAVLFFQLFSVPLL